MSYPWREAATLDLQPPPHKAVLREMPSNSLSVWQQGWDAGSWVLQEA